MNLRNSMQQKRLCCETEVFRGQKRRYTGSKHGEVASNREKSCRSTFFADKSQIDAEQYQNYMQMAKQEDQSGTIQLNVGNFVPCTDIQSLESKGWLTDLVVHRCGLHFVRNYKNKDDQRILFIDPLAIAFAKSFKLNDETSHG